MSFYVANNQMVSINVFSANGVLLNNLIAKPFSKGKQVLPLNTDKLAPGFYCVEINKGGFRSILKYIKRYAMLLLERVLMEVRYQLGAIFSNVLGMVELNRPWFGF